MKYLLSVLCAALLIPLSAHAAPTTWYLDDPAETIFGGITFDGVGVSLDVTGFENGFKETWTGPVPCPPPGQCAQTTPLPGDTFGTDAVLQLIFGVPLLLADTNGLDPVPLTVITNTLFGLTQSQITMTTTFIPTPDSDPNFVPAPATVALLGLGLVGLAWSRRKNA